MAFDIVNLSQLTAPGFVWDMGGESVVYLEDR